ncbi:unnamed protein product [Anisakis simplex]|uniref:Uncharacterized protein n=1 Tax=Anisakis simplex TaxID=6269 RepID=A0A0M3JK90_ANISI|nr:unnamed protein product [Anisakis simplex]
MHNGSTKGHSRDVSCRTAAGRHSATKQWKNSAEYGLTSAPLQTHQ